MRHALCILAIVLSLTDVCQARSVRELDSIAAHAFRIGEYPQAARCYADILSQLPQSQIFDDDRIVYARQYSKCQLVAGGFKEVEELLKDSLYSVDPALRINLAAALGYQERIDEACAILSELLRDSTLDVDLKGVVYQNIGYLLYEQKDFVGVEENLREAAKYFDGEKRFITLSNLALCLGRNGKFREAYPLINEALAGFRELGEAGRSDYIRALSKQAEIYFMNGKKGEAKSSFSKYFSQEKQWLREHLPQLSQTQRLNLWLSKKPQLSHCFLLEDYNPEFLYEVAMFRRQTSLLGMHGDGRVDEFLSIAANDVRKALPSSGVAIEFVSYTDAAGEEYYAAVILPHNGAAKFVKLFPVKFVYEQGVVGENSIFDAIRRDDKRDKELLYSDSRLADMVWNPILRSLPSSTTEIFFAPEGVFHFWGIENMPFMGKSKYTLHRVSTTADIARRESSASKSADILLIGGLDYSAIPADQVAGAKNHIAAETLRQRLGTTDVFNYLPATRHEVDSIRNTFSRARCMYQAEEGRVKTLLPEYDIVHIATHGYSLNLGIRKRPELLGDTLAFDESLRACALALTGANVLSHRQGSDDGLLSARELCDLDLSNVDFVVLSACQTAQGDVTDEGSAGLIRGLKNAGVKTVMASLWSVDDRSTMIFMNQFYRLLHDGNTKLEAYIGAQDYLRNFKKRVPLRRFSPSTLASERTTDYIVTEYDSPFYWAPFILIDDI